MTKSLSKKEHDEFIRWLSTGEFDFFSTLTVSSHSLSIARARERLRRWSAYLNRRVVGKHWLARPDEHLFFFAALEKPKTNLHWHVLTRVPGDGLDENKLQRQKERFLDQAELQWRRLVPSGTFDVQPVYSRSVAAYVAKSIRGEIEYSSFVLPDEFR